MPHRTGTRREVNRPAWATLAIASSPASFVWPYKLVGLHRSLLHQTNRLGGDLAHFGLSSGSYPSGGAFPSKM